MRPIKDIVEDALILGVEVVQFVNKDQLGHLHFLFLVLSEFDGAGHLAVPEHEVYVRNKHLPRYLQASLAILGLPVISSNMLE